MYDSTKKYFREFRADDREWITIETRYKGLATFVVAQLCTTMHGDLLMLESFRCCLFVVNNIDDVIKKVIAKESYRVRLTSINSKRY